MVDKFSRSQDKKYENSHLLQRGNGSVQLSTEEYHAVVKEAYKEGLKDALKEQFKMQEANQTRLGQEEAVQERAREEAKKQQNAQKKLQSLTKHCDKVLLKIKTVFPFDLFPDTVTIDENKISVISSSFFASESVTTILLKEVTDVIVETSIFFAKLVFTYSHHPMKPMTTSVTFLKKKDALEAKRIIQGMLVLRRGENVDLSNTHPEKILSQIEELGEDHGDIIS
jgi:hypothetical protein